MLTVGLLAACATNDPTVDAKRASRVADASLILQGHAFREGAPQRPKPWEGIDRCSLPLSGGLDAGAQRAFDDGLSLLLRGWAYEAERCFHEVVLLAPDHPMGHLGRALAYLRNPDISLLHCWEAWQRRENGSRIERAFVEATARWLGADREPEMEVVNAAWNTQRAVVRQPVLETWGPWAESLAEITASQGGAVEWSALAAWAMAAADRVAARRSMAALGLSHEHPAQWIARSGTQERTDMPPADAARSAPSWSLPKGQGGIQAFPSGGDRPVLLVFFLGFGCLHCVEQLRQLEPLAAEFEVLGIDVLTIGTDKVDGIRASLLDYAETNVSPYPYPVMADPTGEVFKAYGCWDEFDDEALHGTFLIDPEGTIRFSDVSAEPFMRSQQVVADYFAK